MDDLIEEIQSGLDRIQIYEHKIVILKGKERKKGDYITNTIFLNKISGIEYIKPNTSFFGGAGIGYIHFIVPGTNEKATIFKGQFQGLLNEYFYAFDKHHIEEAKEIKVKIENLITAQQK